VWQVHPWNPDRSYEAMNLAATVTIDKACEIVGVSRRTMYYWMRANKVQFVRTAGGSVRILTESLFRPGNVTVENESDESHVDEPDE
jgi:excisionase family DNA binding protein